MCVTVTELAPKQAEKAEAVLRERPSDVLPYVSDLLGVVTFDLETSGLHVDDGATVAVVAVAYRLKSDPNAIWHHAFAFDQGNAAAKGFHTQYFPPLEEGKKLSKAQREMPKYMYPGRPMGDPAGRWDWDIDYNLPIQEWVTVCRWLQEAGQANGLSNQNLKFDLGHMRNGTRFCEGIELEKYAVWDTQLVSPITFPYFLSNALKSVGEQLWGAEEVEEADVVKECLLEVSKRYGLKPSDKRYDLMPAEVTLPYASQDTVLAHRVAELQEQMINEGHGTGNQVVKAVQLMRVLRRMERRGFGPLDIETATRIADEIDERIAKLSVRLPFEPHTGPRAATYFFDELGQTPWKVNEERRDVQLVWVEPKVTAAQLRENPTFEPEPYIKRKVVKQGDCSAVVTKRMAKAGVPGAEEWAEIMELRIANQMFYRNYANLVGKDGNLRADFKQAFVRSGRLSAARVQLHGMPKKLGLQMAGKDVLEPRKLILTPPGLVRMNLDLSQAELRIGALLCNCTKMGDALANGDDLHAMTAIGTLGARQEDPDWKLKRDAGKQGNFSCIYGVGPAKFQTILWERADIEWSLAESRQFVYAWRDTYPEFPRAFHHWLDFAERKRFVPLIDGTPSWMTKPRDFPSSAWNRVVQGSLAVFVRDWLIMIEKRTAKYDALELSVHDSACLLLPEDCAEEICAELAVKTEEMWWKMFNIPGRADVSRW